MSQNESSNGSDFYAESLRKQAAETLQMHDPIAANINVAVQQAHSAAVRSGFWDGDQHNMGEKIALMHSELSELLEAARKGKIHDQCDKPVELSYGEEEAADLFIRLADFCGYYKIDLGEAVKRKHAYNLTRPYKHGKKF